MNKNIATNLYQDLKKVFKGAFFVFIEMVIIQLVIIAIDIIIARSLGPASLGMIALSLLVVNFSLIIFQLGLPVGLARFIAQEKIKNRVSIIKSGLILTLPTAITGSLFLFILAKPIAIYIFHKQELILLIRILSLSLPFNILTQNIVGCLRGFGRAKEKLLITTIEKGFLIIGLVFLLAINSLNLLTVTGLWASSFLVASLASLYFLRQIMTKDLLVFKSTKSTFKRELISFSFPLMLAGFLVALRNSFGTFLVGYWLTPAEVGLYSLAFKLAKIILLPLSFLGFIYLPIASNLLKKNKIAYLQTFFAMINKWGFISIFPLIFLLIVYPTRVINFLFGVNFIPAALVLQILTIGYLPQILNGKTGETLQAGGQTKIILWLNVLSTILGLTLNLFLIPLLTIKGAALATAISFFIPDLAKIFIVKNRLSLWPITSSYVKQIFHCGLVGIFIYFVNRFFLFSLPLSLFFITNILLFYILFLLINELNHGFEKEDLLIFKLVKQAVKKIIFPNDKY